MGFSVGVHWATIPVAYCNEMDCDWTGTLGVTEIQAQREADDHYRWHQAEWERQNEEWDKT